MAAFHYTLHGMLTLHSNVFSDLRIAAEAGFNGLELHTQKLWRYLGAGGTAAHYKQVADRLGISTTAIDIIGDVEQTSRRAQAGLQAQTHDLCRFAAEIACPIIQLNAFCSLDGLSLEQNLEITAQNIRRLCSIGQEYGISFQYEGAAWTPIHRLRDCVRLVDMVDAANLGLVIDFWHLWASRGALPEELGTLDSRYILGVHVCDGLRPPLNPPLNPKSNPTSNHSKETETEIVLGKNWQNDCQAEWQDESVYRKFLPGEGELPVRDWLQAVQNTGYTGSYSGEIINPWLWEQDHLQLACKMKAAMESVLEKHY